MATQMEQDPADRGSRVTARHLQLLVLAVFVACMFALWYVWDHDHQQYDLSIAAGQSTGEAYKLMKAIQTVTRRHHPEIKIKVFETRGSLQNVRLLDRGRVDLATARSDLVLGDRAQLVADLYSDVFQLLGRRGSGINRVADLKGKRIALPPERSAEHESFWFLAPDRGSHARQHRLRTEFHD